MEKHKVILNQLMDLGGLATKNNFYSPEAKTVLGSLVHTRKTFAELEKAKLIQPLSTITKVRNLCQEQFYAITKLGAKYIDRTNEYKWKGGPKSPYNIMHESMVRDIGLSFLRNFPDYIFDINYNLSFEGLRPDMVIRMFHKESMKQYIFLVEVERKKSPDSVVNEKLKVYEEIFSKLNFKKYDLNAPVKVLIIYSNLDYNCFWRPQEYNLLVVRSEIKKLEGQLNHLVKLSKHLPENRYRFLSFQDFYKLNSAIFVSPGGLRTNLIN